MVHEITKNDSPVYVGQPAWHGLGKVVPEDFSPLQGLELADLEWTVEQEPLLYQPMDADEWGLVDPVPVTTHVANVRSDTREILGVVSSGYTVVQNHTMAEFCDSLGLVEDSPVRCETVGSIGGGRKTWFLLRGKSFDVAKGDSIYPYVLVSNGHDGSSSFRVTPTTVRVVCSNTLHAVIPRDDSVTQGAAIVLRHSRNVNDRVEEARQALRQYGAAIEDTRKVAEHLAAKPVTSETVQEFFLSCYTHEFGEIPSNPKNAAEERRVNKAQSAYNSFSRRFDDERGIAGASYWNAFNSFSGLIQHDMKARGRDDQARVESRVNSNMFGLNQKRTQAALATAYEMSF